MQINHPKILVIEDHVAIRRFLKTSLMHQEYQFFEAETGRKGLALAIENKPDVILLDLGLPDMDGTEAIKQLRTWTSTPIIILSARDQEHHKIEALDLGADDYLTKPFSVSELLARLRVALRHAKSINEIESPVLQFDHFKIDLIGHHVFLSEKKINLSPIQFTLLTRLIRNANKIVTHKQLLKEVWGEHCEDIDYLRIYIHQLRQKLEENPTQPKYLKTEPGIGYRFICSLNEN